MVDKTRAQLVERALQILVPLAVGSHSAEDTALVDGMVEPMLDELNALGITYIGNPDAIPLAQFNALAILLADTVKSDFGLNTLLPLADPGQARSDLRTMNAGTYSRAVLAAEYF
jgi:hypothetical protein